MSADASAGAREEPDLDSDDYEEMLDALQAAKEEARRKVEKGRVYDPENERVRIKWIRALGYIINIERQVTTDRDLEELTERLETVEEQQGFSA